MSQLDPRSADPHEPGDRLAAEAPGEDGDAVTSTGGLGSPEPDAETPAPFAAGYGAAEPRRWKPFGHAQAEAHIKQMIDLLTEMKSILNAGFNGLGTHITGLTTPTPPNPLKAEPPTDAPPRLPGDGLTGEPPPAKECESARSAA